MFVIQADLVLRQGYIAEKVAQIEQKIFHFKQYVSWWFGD